MAQITDLQDLLKHELKDLYSAETQIIDALPKMVENAHHPKLKSALQDHLAVTREQKKRLDKIQQLLGEEPMNNANKGFFASLFSSDEGEEHCKATEGLIKEGEKMMSEDMTPEVADAAIIAACQKIEHYEISSYGTARAFALQLGLHDVARLLTQTLNEEYHADDSLTEIALREVNLDAEMGEGMMVNSRSGGQKNTGGNTSQGKNSAGNKKNAKSVAGKKSSSKKSAPPKAAGNKSSGNKKSAPNKAAGNKGSAKKAPAPKKSAPKKAAAKKSSAPKKAASKSSGNKKAAPKKAAGKKSSGNIRSAAPKRASARSAGNSKKTASKKTAAPKSKARRR